MKIEVLGKGNFTPGQHIEDYANKRLAKVIKLFGEDQINTVRVLCKIYKDHHKVEITITAGGNIIRAEVDGIDMYAAIDLAVDKLVRQIRKHKEKLSSHLDKQGYADVFKNSKEQDLDILGLEKEVLATQLVKNKKIELKPMTVEEALTAMDLIDHDFYIFQDKDSGRTNVIYRRDDGDYAIIETKTV
ncbi:MAG: ribosome-associated translation inhibitor RaiA [Acholeplasmataceae bacterium]|jgi:putative sigma-54 modulation protein|nr:ribosome-associated translation inhibitor RaiA [Acholeplasmataceae bacterium]